MAQPTTNPSFSQKIFAWTLGTLMQKSESHFKHVKEALCSQIVNNSQSASEPFTVAEIGLGAAPNLRYYSQSVSKIIGIDYNSATHQYARSEAQRLGLPANKLELVTGVAEQLPLDDNSIDVVLMTHVLCSVTSQTTALKECKRVLKPGGMLLFMEHVVAPADSSLRTYQKVAKPLCRALGDGCDVMRDTAAAIQAAGFSSVDIESHLINLPLPARVYSPHVSGVCIK